MKEFLTESGYLDLKKELDFYTQVKRLELSESLRYASSLGDLRENAEFDAALQDYQEIETKIYKLKKTLDNCIIVKKEENIINVGSTVTIKEDEEITIYEIVAPSNVDPLNNKISYLSDFGSQIIGKKSNDIVTIKTNNLTYDIEILYVK